MREYVLMTDSCCDLEAEVAEQLELTVLPLSFRIEGKSYRNLLDGSEMGFQEFYNRLHSGAMSETAAVNVGEYLEVMRPILEQGKDILCVCFSSALSTTYQSARIAAGDLQEEFPEATICVIDSLSASRGQGLLLYLAAQQKQAGKSLEEVRDYILETIPHLCHWFTVGDLEYLRRGGRLSGTMALLGSMLNIKPVLHTDDQGRLVPMSKVRGRKAALKALVNKMEELGIAPLEEQTVFICQADCQDEAEAVAQEIRDRFHVKDVVIHYIGPVIGSHTGPGTMGVFFLGKNR